MYDLCKTLANELRKVALLPSLHVIWAWMQHLQFGEALPPDLEVPQQVRWMPPGPTKGIYEWELAILAKELIVVAPDRAKADFRSWRRFSASVNKLKELDDSISAYYADLFKKHILIELYRTAHHQFWWQRTVRLDADATRYLKVFSDPAVDTIIRDRLGFDTRVLYTIGLAIAGHFLKESQLRTPVSFNLAGVNIAQINAFLDKYGKSLAQMRFLCKEAQSFDENFIYALNPLLQFPLVSHVVAGNTWFIAPIPRYLLRRFTEGVYYDVMGAPGFDAAFGSSYQKYVGEVLGAVNDGNRLVILPEAEYAVGKDKKRSVDWIASDSSGELFIECKTKRLRLDAKIALADLGPLEAEISKLSEFAVQIYKTLAHATQNLYQHWKPSSRPIYPLIVTLEEWYVFGHRLDAEIDSRVRKAFQENGLDEKLLDQYPLTICSAAEFERLMALVALKGIRVVMEQKVTKKRRLWLLHSALHEAFPEDFHKTRTNLFPAALASITG